MLINEVLASHTGTDDTEFIELYGAPGTSLGGLSLIVVESDAFDPGRIDRRFDFKPFHQLDFDKSVDESNYLVDVTPETCKACTLCVRRCPMDAIQLKIATKADSQV